MSLWVFIFITYLKGLGYHMLKVFEAFSGIGTQHMALRNLNLDYEVVAIAEIDKFAIKSYEAIHGKSNNVGDISKLKAENIPDHDLFTYSFPCQDISLAGRQKGFKKDSGTRSSLLWECNRVIELKKPKYLLLENVKNLVGKRFKDDFDDWLMHLETLGYTNYWQVVNAKDYGVPQNRERVFVVSILGEHDPYVFPEPLPLTIELKDILEKEVADKYYLSDDKVSTLKRNSQKKGRNFISQPVQYNRKDGIGKDLKVGHTINSSDWRGLNRNQTQNAVIAASRGRYVKDDGYTGRRTEQHLELNQQGTSNALTTVQKDNYVIEPPFRLRKLTPKECWRLMGCTDEDFHKAEVVNSNTQLYKQAGNAIVVDVLEHLFRQLFL